MSGNMEVMVNGHGDDGQGQIVKLRSSDEKIYTVPVKVASVSNTIKTMYSDFDLKDTDEPINLANITSDILEKVIEYAKKHHTDEEKEKIKDEDLNDDDLYSMRSDELSDWDCDFFKVEPKVLHQIMLAANYLDIPSLLESACRVVVNKIKGKTPEEIRKMLSIKKDLSPEQEDQIKKENQWIEEK